MTRSDFLLRLGYNDWHMGPINYLIDQIATDNYQISLVKQSLRLERLTKKRFRIIFGKQANDYNPFQVELRLKDRVRVGYRSDIIAHRFNEALSTLHLILLVDDNQ